ncbi:hypothetical protein UFOVP156_48 [uncultured Caudovirales phage]|uniref:Uncharacterized protein n=1 Tax=uncultured Caudovirales phage TaxID=2100421 RepID=A0A6J7WDL6_9CAUD|nr:hypothetical protein UFOVP156_48 [uncultured Caudovirales phage]
MLSPEAKLPSVVGLGNPKANVGFTQDPQATLGGSQVPCVKSATQPVPAPANSASSISTLADNTLPYYLPRGSGGKKCVFGSHKMSDVVSFISGYLYSHPTPISQSAGRFSQVVSGLLARSFGAERVPLAPDLAAFSRRRHPAPALCACPKLGLVVGFCYRKPVQNVVTALRLHPAERKLLLICGELFDPALDRKSSVISLDTLDYLLSCDAIGRVSGMTGEQASTRADANMALDDAALADALSVVAEHWECGSPLNWRIDTPRERHFYVALTRRLSWHPSVIERCWLQLKARGLVESARRGNWGARGLKCAKL